MKVSRVTPFTEIVEFANAAIRVGEARVGTELVRPDGGTVDEKVGSAQERLNVTSDV